MTTSPEQKTVQTRTNAHAVVAVHSAKGGVGKSTVSVNLAVGLAQRGLRVGLLDADIHGPSATLLLGNADWPDPGPEPNTIHPLKAHGIHFISMGNIANKQTPLIWRGAMVHNMLSQFYSQVLWPELDILLIDMPPGTGDALLTTAQADPPSGVIVVSTPQELSLLDTVRGVRAFRDLNVPILGFVENMSFLSCTGCGYEDDLFGKGAAEAVAEQLGFPFLGALPIDSVICDSGDAGVPFVLARSASASVQAMNAIVDKVHAGLDDLDVLGAWSLEWAELDWLTRVAEPPEQREAAGYPLRALWQVSRDELGLMWADGTTQIIGTRPLRLACPCARCVDEISGEPLLDPDTVPSDITLRVVKSVGRYGLAPVFSDGHKSGIFSFPYLRALGAPG
ncbi:P-loop NTPase [Acanthopleuribacter pedis]|uniref:Iron-sulfur cluster carrier protein n=1 Tax=Acanthopleuribacter pedis TaxID=442870 RepID=A0A8J7U534_9BACT|nr:P-loop NTPase [Acanthopleuribacter pedis]